MNSEIKEIPDDVARLIQMSVDKKKAELEKIDEERKRQENKRVKAEQDMQAAKKITVELAKKNFLNLNKLLKEEPLKSYLDLEERTGFPLWEEHFKNDPNPALIIFLKNDGVYKFLDDHAQRTKNYVDVEKITLNFFDSLEDSVNNTGLYHIPEYIWSLERWNAPHFVEYLKKQFTPII